MKINAAVVTKHAEEAAFLWFLRDRAVGASHYSLADLARLDARLEAQLDGLRVAGAKGWAICEAIVADEVKGRVFAAGVLALESDDPGRLQPVLEAAMADRSASRGLVSALGWLPYPQVKKVIQRLLDTDDPASRRVGIAASAAHRRGPGPALGESLTDPDPVLRARALRAGGELGVTSLLDALSKSLADQDLNCRFWAAWSSALLGDAKSVRILQGLAEDTGPRREDAGKMAFRRMEFRVAKEWQRVLARDPDSRRLAVVGAGVMGDPAEVPWLIEQIAVPELARVAGEALTMITGADIALQALERERPESSQEPKPETAGTEADADLSWPDQALVEKWWAANRGAFKAGERHLLGLPIAPKALDQVIRDGRQRQRAAAALELALSKPGQPLFEVRANAGHQLKLLRA